MELVCVMSIIKYDNIQNAIKNAGIIVNSHSSKELTLLKDSFQYELALNYIESILENSKQVPALGVAINDEVVAEKKNKDWVEFSFNKRCECDGMFFDGLLIFLEKDISGFNVFRKIDDKYDGRCYYINLQNNFNNIL